MNKYQILLKIKQKIWVFLSYAHSACRKYLNKTNKSINKTTGIEFITYK